MKLLIFFLVLNLFQDAIRLKTEVEAQFENDFRIIGGNKVNDIREYTFTAVLIEAWGHMTTFFCACTKVSYYWALTTATCDMKMRRVLLEQRLYVRGNTTNWKESGGDDHQVYKTVRHKLFNNKNKDYDVAAIQVRDGFTIKTELIPLVFTSKNFQYTKGANISTLGWGVQTMTGLGDPIQELYKIDLQITDWNYCKRDFRGVLTKRMFCAGAKFKGPCTHDRGGPTYWIDRKTNKKYLVGMVSFTYDGLCGVSAYTSIFTNLRSVKKWIWNTISSKSNADADNDDNGDKNDKDDNDN